MNENYKIDTQARTMLPADAKKYFITMNETLGSKFALSSMYDYMFEHEENLTIITEFILLCAVEDLPISLYRGLLMITKDAPVIKYARDILVNKHQFQVNP